MAFDEVTFFEFHLHGDPNFAPSITSGSGEEAVGMADGGESIEAATDDEGSEDEGGADADDAGGGLGKALAFVALLVVVALLMKRLRGDDGVVDRIED